MIRRLSGEKILREETHCAAGIRRDGAELILQRVLVEDRLGLRPHFREEVRRNRFDNVIDDFLGLRRDRRTFGFGGGFTKFEGTIQVIDNESTGVLFAYNVKKGNFQSAAEAFAKHFKDDYLQKK